MVQIKATAAALVAAAVIAPAVAQSYYAEDAVVAREDYNDFNDVFARDLEFDLQERDFDHELFEREPILGINHIKKWLKNRKAKKLAKQQAAAGGAGPASADAAPPSAGAAPDSAPPQAREFEDFLSAREFDVEDLLVRDPFMGMRHLKKFLGKRPAGMSPPSSPAMQSPPPSAGAQGPASPMQTRDFDEIEAREPLMGMGRMRKIFGQRHGGPRGHMRGGPGGMTPPPSAGAPGPDSASAAPPTPATAQSARELGAEYEEVLARYFDDLYERELASEDELLARDFEDAEVFGRSPEPLFGWFKKLFGKKTPPAADASAASASPAAREFDDLD